MQLCATSAKQMITFSGRYQRPVATVDIREQYPNFFVPPHIFVPRNFLSNI